MIKKIFTKCNRIFDKITVAKGQVPSSSHFISKSRMARMAKDNKVPET